MSENRVIGAAAIQPQDRVLEQNPLDMVSRDHWANAVGAVLARSYAPVLLHKIVDAEFDEFERVARHELSGHGFTQDNFRRIFAIMQRTARLNPLNGGEVNIEMLEG